MKEYHEHDNHPDYKFNVEVRSLWTDSGRPTELHIYAADSFEPEIHALIYCDDSIAITMYEHCYAMCL
jgi:hypothetical protein